MNIIYYIYNYKNVNYDNIKHNKKITAKQLSLKPVTNVTIIIMSLL